jgi:autotransporter-associated beta strand protein
MKKCVCLLVAAGLVIGGQVRAADEYWRTDGTAGGTWSSTYWNIGAPNAAGGTGWTAGNNAIFTSNSTLTFATSTIGNVTVSNNAAVTITQAGTLTLGGVRTFDIGAGATLTWTSQGQSTAVGNEGAGIIKNGAGTLDVGAIAANVRVNGNFTINAGTLIVSGNGSLGTNNTLTLNGGLLQSSGTRAFGMTNLVVGGDFALAGTGNANWDAAPLIALGAATRTISNATTSGSRQFRGLIAGDAGVGLNFVGSGGAQIYIGNTGNTFSGSIGIYGGEVAFNGNGALGAGTAITLDGGRLTMASMNTAGTASALTAATINSGRTIYLGDTAGTAISVSGATGVTTNYAVLTDAVGKTGSWAKQGSGLLALSAVNSYSGNTAINNGTLQLISGDNRLPVSTTVSLGQSASANLGILDLNGCNQQVAGLNSVSGNNVNWALKNTLTNSSATAATLTLGGSGTYVFGDGSTNNSGVIAGNITVVMNGSGTQTLGDTNTYTGGTFINSGKLALSGAGSLASSVIDIKHSATFDVSGTTAGSLALAGGKSLTNNGTFSGGLIIQSGASVLGGGSFNGPVTNKAGGYLSPGNGGHTNFFTALTLAGASTNHFWIGSAANHDMSTVSNSLTYTGDGTQMPQLKLDFSSYTWNSGDEIVLYNNLFTGTSDFTGANRFFQFQDAFGNLTNLYNNTLFSAVTAGSATNLFRINYDALANGDGQNNDIAITAIPEPSSLSLLTVFGAAYWLRRRLNRRARYR